MLIIKNKWFIKQINRPNCSGQDVLRDYLFNFFLSSYIFWHEKTYEHALPPFISLHILQPRNENSWSTSRGGVNFCDKYQNVVNQSCLNLAKMILYVLSYILLCCVCKLADPGWPRAGLNHGLSVNLVKAKIWR